MDCLIVSHTHWDREWYRPFQAFRARLVDTVDRVLDLLDDDETWCFQLDGQSIVVEDYLAIRPGRRAQLEAAVRSRRLAVGPWYVQPDSLLPSGESHVRNLLEGRRVAESVGGCARVAYTPDSFGHPAQFPQLFAGFGLGPFTYWRGDADDTADAGPAYRWVAPDGTGVTAWRLTRGYFDAAGTGAMDPTLAAKRLAELGQPDADAGGPVVLMAGIDHALPEAGTRAVAEALARETGWDVRRALLDELRELIAGRELEDHAGELLGSRLTNLLPGVWSTRTWIKVANRRAETALLGWAEPWAALGRRLGVPDEQPALREAWRALLANHAHDSICGCSQDHVHEQMRARFDTATELAEQTTARVLERLAGLGPERKVPWSTGFDLAVFNPSPFPRTDVVRVALDGVPLFGFREHGLDIHPLALVGASVQGYTVDGEPVRTMSMLDDPTRVRMLEDFPPYDVEFVVRDVPAFGYARVRLEPADAAPDTIDGGRSITNGDVTVSVADDGTLDVELAGSRFSGLTAIDDTGDRGDSYDFEPVPGPDPELRSVAVSRARHVSGIERLTVTRVFALPASLSDDRGARSTGTADVTVVVEARVAPGVDRVDLDVTVDNEAHDHRLRLAFPTGAAAEEYAAATTFDVARRRPGLAAGEGWMQQPVSTVPVQGWIATNGLCVVAPGLAEGEVTAEGTILFTVLRAVGWLSRMDLPSRPMPAGPGIPTPAAQVPGRMHARVHLLAESAAHRARGAELGLRAVPAGDEPLLEPGRSLLAVSPETVEVSALKPAETGDGSVVVRLLNPSAEPATAELVLGLETVDVRRLRLDETSLAPDVVERTAPATVRATIRPHGLETLAF
jgi:alpha-mannosidase